MDKWIKEWKITYSIHDGEGGLDEFLIILPSFWKVLWWFIRKGRKACMICIYTFGKWKDGQDGDLFV